MHSRWYSLPKAAKGKQKVFEIKNDRHGILVLYYQGRPAPPPTPDGFTVLPNGNRFRVRAKVEGFALLKALEPLIELPNWVVWRWVIRTDKNGKVHKTKVPYQPHKPKVKASTKRPDTWADYAARAVAESGKADGIGFCLLGTEFVAFDLRRLPQP